MTKVAMFEKVSYNEFLTACATQFSEGTMRSVNWKEYYDALKLPERKTKFSAGYDFHLPYDINIPANGYVTIPLGVKCSIDDDYVLQLHIRSSYATKKNLMLVNCTGIIDADYYNNPENEGHIMIKLKNNNPFSIIIKQGDCCCQGIFVQYGITIDDDAKDTRIGGFGSTGK